MMTSDMEDKYNWSYVTAPLNTNSTEQNNTNITAPARSEELAKIEIAVQATIFGLAVIGNSCVLIALGRRTKKSTRMHIFIMHLSIADLLVAFLNILPQLIWDITHIWQGGDFLCRVVKYAQIFVMYLSTYILVMTAIDRYRAICHPLSNHTWTPRLVNVMIGGAYAISAVMSLPQIFMFKYQETVLGSGNMDCWVHFEPPWTLQLYITSFTAFVYVIPFCILVACYGSICITIWRKYRLSKDSGNYVTKEQRKPSQAITVQSQKRSSRAVTLIPRTHSFRGFSRAKLKTVKLTFVIIIAYLACWSPFFISQLWWLYDETAMANNAVVIMLLLASLNSCCNPWIYLAFSGSLIKNILPCDCSTKRKTGLPLCSGCLCACSQNRKLNSPRHKRKWTFRSADSYESSRSTNVSGIRNEHKFQVGSVIQNNGAILAEGEEDESVLNGKNDIRLTTYGTLK